MNKPSRPKSRLARWSDACSRALESLEELRDLQSEYQNWLDNPAGQPPERDFGREAPSRYGS